jgi:hypothetical protein
MPDPAAAGAKFATMYTEEKTRARLKSVYTKNPTKYECLIIANVTAYFHPEKFSTARFINIAANPVPRNRKIIYQMQDKSSATNHVVYFLIACGIWYTKTPRFLRAAQWQISCFTINPYVVVHDKFQCPRKGVFGTQLVTLTLAIIP